MISPRSRALLDRYALASTALSRTSGERLATEAGNSVEFRDFRPYQRGDELRYVDWRGYARTGRLYTRLYQAERTIALHVLLDTSGSMRLGAKARYARLLAQLLAYAAQKDARSQVHLIDGRHSAPAQGRAGIVETWRFIDEASDADAPEVAPLKGITDFALTLPPHAGAALVLVVSDLLDPAPLRPALTALRARGLDAGFLQVVAAEDLDPEEGHLEVVDSESGATLEVTPDEVRAYRTAVRSHLERVRGAVTRAGFRHALLRTEGESDAELERAAFAALIREGILVRR